MKDLNPDVPDELVEVVEKLMQKCRPIATPTVPR